jgi:asparagine synthase (glutamine-hydrolysing)
MCGIVGFIDFTNRSTDHNLIQMISTLNHRGPDGSGFNHLNTSAAQVGLAHSRLSIIDLSTAAAQPMHFDGLYLSFNGEVYNFIEIRNRLIHLGYSFSTTSDTEVVLKSWHHWGESAISMWRGMFSISIYDSKNENLYLIRDRAGVKPLYYFWDNDLFLFGSELKSLLPHPGYSKSINEHVLGHFLQYGYIPAPHSIYRGTRKLLPGHLLRFNINSRNVSAKSYWNIYDHYILPKYNLSFGSALIETERVLAEAFELRLVSDVPVGVFLSGGYDSTCVTALLQKNKTEKLRTYTIGTHDSSLNEAPAAKLIANHLGTDHTEIYCTPNEIKNIISDLPYIFDEPHADSSSLPSILISRTAKKHVTVAISADGGDELFAGYNRYHYFIQYAKFLHLLPVTLRSSLSRLLSRHDFSALPLFRNQSHIASRLQKLSNLLNCKDSSKAFKSFHHVFTDAEIDALLLNPSQYLDTQFDKNSKYFTKLDGLSNLMAIDFETYLTDDVLTKVDRSSMSASLESREPFLDHHVVEWAARLPSNFKYKGGEKKYILKEIVHQYVPAAFMNQKKMGFAIPLADWLFTELKPLVFNYLSRTSLSTHMLFNPDFVERLLNSFYGGRKDQYLRVWHLLMFQMWYDRWMKN